MVRNSILRQIINIAQRKNITLAVAESCTGGLISHLLTNISGSSKYFKLGIVAYSNQAKIKILKVSPAAIKKFGAVSPIIAEQMAKKIKIIAKTNIGLSCTGVAGPTAETTGKPIGTVYIGLALPSGYMVKKFKFSGSRTKIKNMAADKALQLITKCLKQI